MDNYQNQSNSTIQGIMGAKVTLAAPGKSMYLVIGNVPLSESLIVSSGGEVTMQLSAFASLVTLPFNGYTKLKSHHDIKKIGPITVDIEKFNRTVEMLTMKTTNQ